MLEALGFSGCKDVDELSELRGRSVATKGMCLGKAEPFQVARVVYSWQSGLGVKGRESCGGEGFV